MPNRKFTAADLTAGKTYRVITGFVDYDGIPHPIGESWLFLAGCSPAAPASASPTAAHCEWNRHPGKNFLSRQPSGRSVKDFHLPSQAAAPFGGFDPSTIGRF